MENQTEVNTTQDLTAQEGELNISQENEEVVMPVELRNEFKDYITQFKLGSAGTVIDQDGDRNIFLKDIPQIMTLLNEPKISQEKLDAIIEDLDLPPNREETTLNDFMKAVVPHLENYGSKDEFI